MKYTGRKIGNKEQEPVQISTLSVETTVLAESQQNNGEAPVQVLTIPAQEQEGQSIATSAMQHVADESLIIKTDSNLPVRVLGRYGTQYLPAFDFTIPTTILIDYDPFHDEWLFKFAEKEHGHSIYSRTQWTIGSILGSKWDKDVKAWRFTAASSVLTEVLEIILRLQKEYERNIDSSYYRDQYEIYSVIEMTQVAKAIAESRRELEERWTKLQSDIFAVSPTQDYVPEFPLMDHQHNGIEFALSQNSCLIADDMGTGKTRCALDAIMYRVKTKQISRALVLCPNTVKHVWLNQSKKFYPDEIEPMIIKGSYEMRIEGLKVRFLASGKLPLYIMNYESARLHPVELQKILDDGMLILDECHKIKSARSQITHIVHDLTPKFSLLLTGTPIVNKPEDAWSIFHFIRHGLVGRSYEEFFRTYCRLDSYSRRIHYVNLKDFNRRVKPFYIRRLKKDVLINLPEKIIHEYKVAMGEKQFELYKDMALKLRAELLGMGEDSYATQATNILSKILRLQQISDGFLSAGAPSYQWIPDASKIKAVKELLEEYIGGGEPVQTNILTEKAGDSNEVILEEIKNGKKVVIFSRFLPPLEMLKLELAEYNPALLYGGIPEDRRGVDGTSPITTQVGRFWNDNSCRVFLCQIQTGGLGIDLSCADTAIFFDYWWSPGINQQAEDRLHRQGQKNAVNVIYMLTTLPDERGSIEGLYYERLQEKKEWIIEAIEGTESYLPSRDELIDWLGKVI